MRNRFSRGLWVTAGTMAMSLATTADAGFVDLSSVSAGLVGSTFNGSLDGVSVFGSATGGIESYYFNGTGASFGNSTTNGTSPQYSYANIYDPSAPGVDRVGYSFLPNSFSQSITITFGGPVTNPRFHVANLSGAFYTFSLTGGLDSVSLVRGNGGDGDGLQVVGNVVSDANPATFDGLSPTTAPPTAGPRSAYGTVSLNGTFSTLSIAVNAVHGDGGSFTLSSVPEPSAVAGVGGLALLRRRRRVARSHLARV